MAEAAGEDYDIVRVLGELEAEMMEAAAALEYERAALIRDQIAELKQRLHGQSPKPAPSPKPRPKYGRGRKGK